MLRLGRLCKHFSWYHKLSRRGSGCGRSGRCDAHSLLTGFPEISFASKPFFAWNSAGVSIIRFLRALCNRRQASRCLTFKCRRATTGLAENDSGQQALPSLALCIRGFCVSHDSTAEHVFGFGLYV